MEPLARDPLCTQAEEGFDCSDALRLKLGDNRSTRVLLRVVPVLGTEAVVSGDVSDPSRIGGPILQDQRSERRQADEEPAQDYGSERLPEFVHETKVYIGGARP